MRQPPRRIGAATRQPAVGRTSMLHGRPAPSSPAPRGKTALFALGGIAALVFAMAWNPPTASVHSFTEASDYRVDKESGCTNSGDGCHGSESDYRDFNAYHPNAKCTTCHEYQGVGCIPCHAPREHECALCHDGSMKRAPDRVRITDPYPRGHYRETTHTATATDFKREMRAAPEGEAKATCSDCHSRDLAASHKGVPVVDGSTYGADVGCGECHNDVRSFGQAEVLSDWKVRSCEACHKVGSSSPMHDPAVAAAVEADDPLGCSDSGSGCHESSDLHALHADAPKDCSGSAADGEPVCHDLELESHAPTARTCGGTSDDACHRSDDPSGYIHKNTDSAHAPETGRPAALTSFASTACGACHLMAPDGRSLIAEHGRATSSGAAGGVAGCRNCHDHEASAAAIEDDWAARDTDASCATCHDGGSLDAAHESDLVTVHTVAAGSEGCADTGDGCHPGTDLSAVGDGALHRDCVRCHDATPSDGNLGFAPDDRTCGSGRDCHAKKDMYDPKTGVHAGQKRVDGRDALHTASKAQMTAGYRDAASGTSTPCSACHGGVLGAEHARSTSSLAASNACTGCHSANAATAAAVKGDWAARASSSACSACHRQGGAEPVHAGIAQAHTATQKDHDGVITATYCSRVGCHGTADVRTLHAEKGCAQAVCHSATGDIRGSGIMTCGGEAGDERACHTGYSAHPDFYSSHVATEIAYDGTVGPGGCAQPGCHPSANVTVLHKDTPQYCYQSECHAANGPKKMTCGGNDPTVACHTGYTKHQEFYTKHKSTEIAYEGTVGPGGCAKPGCHPSADVTVVHEHKCAIAGCHVEGGPSGKMTCGGKDAATACHTDGTKHLDFYTVHQAKEISRDETATAGTCVKAGCHASADVTTVHEHKCAIAGCHVEGGPSGKMSCGGKDATTACHTDGTKHLEWATKHQATEIAYDGTVGPGGCARPGCHPTADVTTLHRETEHACYQAGCHAVGGPGRMTCGGNDPTTACHTGSTKHQEFYTKHQATERDSSGAASPGACVTSGCHGSVDATSVHHHKCYISGCHVEGGPTVQTCGGSAGQTDTCHNRYDANEHFQDHGAELNGTVAGVTYGPGENAGCLGSCHSGDLVTEHRIRMIGGGLEGGGATVCSICHLTSSPGAYASSTAVKSAISGHDRRCVSCHAGTEDGAAAVAAPPVTCEPAAFVLASRESVGTASPNATSTATSLGKRAGERLRLRRSVDGTSTPELERPARADKRSPVRARRTRVDSVPPEPPGTTTPDPTTTTEPDQQATDQPAFKVRHVTTDREDDR